MNQKKESDEEILKRVNLLAVSILFIVTLFKLDSLLVVHNEMCNLCADAGSIFKVAIEDALGGVSCRKLAMLESIAKSNI